MQRTGGVVLSNAALVGVCWLAGAPWLYLTERGALDSDEVAIERGHGEVLEIATSP